MSIHARLAPLLVLSSFLRPAAAQASILPVGVPVHGVLNTATVVQHEVQQRNAATTLSGVAHELEVAASGTFTIEARSHFFDTCLVLVDADGAAVAEDNNGWLRTHSRLVCRLEQGRRFRVLVVSRDAGVGAYEITLRDGVHAALAGGKKLAAELEDAQAELRARREEYGDGDHARVARSLHSVANCQQSFGRFAEAMPQIEAALAMQRRLYGEADMREVATGLNNLAVGLKELGRAAEALPHYEVSLAMRQRLFGAADHPDVSLSLNNVAECLGDLGRPAEALPRHEASLAMKRRLLGERDHATLATSLQNLAMCLLQLGRTDEALPHVEAALAMRQRLFGAVDHPGVATTLHNLATCLESLGRTNEAMARHEASLAMRLRLHGSTDNLHVAASLTSSGKCLRSLGRPAEALPRLEASVAMYQRLHGERGHPDLVTSLYELCECLESLGRANEALPWHEAALAMARRLYADQDHPRIAGSLDGLAGCMVVIGRATEALPRFEASLAMFKRLHGERDHPDVVASMNNMAPCKQTLGCAAEALSLFEAALAMQRRMYAGRDHPQLAKTLSNLGNCLTSLGRAQEALVPLAEMTAMHQRLFGAADHPHAARGLNNAARCLQSLGRATEALPLCERAVAMIERLRDDSRISAELRQSYFDDLKHGGAFERLQAITAQLGRTAEAWQAGERGRGRGLLDLIDEQRFDASAEAERRARQRGDAAAATRLTTLRSELAAAGLENDRLLHELTRLADEPIDEAARATRRDELLALANASAQRHRRLLDERARLLGDVLPVGRVRTVHEVQATLQPGELLLQFTVTMDTNLLYLLAREGEVEVVALPTSFPTVERTLPDVLREVSKAQLAARGRDPEQQGPASMSPSTWKRLHELFTSLIPPAVWERVRGSKRVFVAAHRALHRLPFELLVTGIEDGKPVYWLDNGPEIAYVPSGSALYWLRQRAGEAGDDVTSLDLLAVGDPRSIDRAPEVPEEGVFVVAVNEGGEGARAGIQPGDVLVRYDGQPLADDKAMRDARMATERAIEDGKRDGSPIAVQVWRRGAVIDAFVQPGVLGVQIGPGKARAAFAASLGSGAGLDRITRSGEIERMRMLPPLRGARAETEAIEGVFAGKGGKSRRLLGDEATEPAVFDLAPKAKYLHFACHGIAEEYAGQSLSMLVLSQPVHVLPGADGLLKLGDLLHHWRGRLAACRLVVLSACRTNVGPTMRDEAPQALPIGFLFAGAPAVISSLWAVDDASTRELMIDFYGRLLAGETGLAAFTAARKSLRQKYPDPFHWAPFLYLGGPE